MLQNSPNVRLPPDSSGKRLRVIKFIEIPYAGMTTLLEPGDHVRIRRNGVLVTHGFIKKVADEGGTGILAFVTHHDHQTPSEGILAGDSIERNESGSYIQRATATGPDLQYHVNVNAIVSGDNPFFVQHVDQYGAAYVRFAEGAVTFDGTGRLRQVNNMTIMATEFHELDEFEFTKVETNGGVVSHNSTQQAIVMSTSGAAGEVAGVVANKTLYHEANASLFADMSVRIGDTGKANVLREWGIFNWDHSEGIFFKLHGTHLDVVLRNKSSGVPVDTEIPQSEWNIDGLGVGTLNPSLFKLDLTKVNSYWFELVQDGAGVAKFGVFNENNVRILCHSFQGNNTQTTGFLTSGSFPFHVHQVDEGGGSTSEIFWYACSAEMEGPNASVTGKFYEGCSDPVIVNSTANWTPVFSISPAPTELSGEVNRNIVLPRSISLDACDAADDQIPRRVKIEIFRHKLADNKLTGAVWAKRKGNTLTDYRATLGNDLGATAFSSSGAEAVAEWVVRGNAIIDTHSVFNYLDKYLCNMADGSQVVYTVGAKVVDPGVSASVVLAVTWEEIESH